MTPQFMSKTADALHALVLRSLVTVPDHAEALKQVLRPIVAELVREEIDQAVNREFDRLTDNLDAALADQVRERSLPLRQVDQ